MNPTTKLITALLQIVERVCVSILCAVCCCVEAIAAEPAPSPGKNPPRVGGVTAIWLQAPGLDPEAILKMPVVKGGQVVVQWAAVEPAKGKYDFSQLDSQLADYARRGLPVTVQLNGNIKPHYLFDEVPYVKETGREVPAFQQVKNREGTLMYWHPAHERAYVQCLTAFRDHLASSEFRTTVIGLRMNFNPFGTELIHIQPAQTAAEYAQKERWLQPPQLDRSLPYNGFNEEDALDYVRRIIRKHIELFGGVLPMFIRSTVSTKVLAEFSEYLEQGTFGIFETGSCLAPFCRASANTEAWILKYCKNGKTVGYAESYADAWGVHDTIKDDLLLSPPQAFYWRVLCDLHKGISYIACYGRDLNVALTGTYESSLGVRRGRPTPIQYSDSRSGFDYRGEFTATLAWADTYAGYHARPAEAPGAWIAFRASTAVGLAEAAPDEKLRGPEFTGDYTYLMERLPDDTTGVIKVGPDPIRYGGYARRLPAGSSLRLKTDSRFLRSLSGSCRLRVIYFDDAAGSSFTVALADQAWNVALRGGKRWQTAEWTVAARQLAASADSGQIVIRNAGVPLSLHLVALERK